MITPIAEYAELMNFEVGQLVRLRRIIGNADIASGRYNHIYKIIDLMDGSIALVEQIDPIPEPNTHSKANWHLWRLEPATPKVVCEND